MREDNLNVIFYIIKRKNSLVIPKVADKVKILKYLKKEEELLSVLNKEAELLSSQHKLPASKFNKKKVVHHGPKNKNDRKK